MQRFELSASLRQHLKLAGNRFPPPVLIDEVQYAPGLLPYIKLAVDADRKSGAFWLTGSQQFLLMRGITETLAGRIAVLPLLGLPSRERHEPPRGPQRSRCRRSLPARCDGSTTVVAPLVVVPAVTAPPEAQPDPTLRGPVTQY